MSLVHVAVGVVENTQGKVLIALRSPNQHQGDLWEFPGGKVEAGEPVAATLARELVEELGIVVLDSEPLIQITHSYPDKTVLLDVYKVRRFSGVAQGKEGQPLRWVKRDQLGDYSFPLANQGIVAALRLPERMAIAPDFATPQDAEGSLQRAFAKQAGGVYFRAHHSGSALSLDGLSAAFAICRDAQVPFVVNQALLPMARGAAGLHLSARELMTFKERPANSDLWLGASCHDWRELRMAQELGVDYAFLSPIKETESHPGARPIGWNQFAEWVAAVPFPVFALGGMSPDDQLAAKRCGAQGIAGIGAFFSRK